MIPDTRYAILGLLLQGPGHGYGLAKRFGELLGPGWAINRGQVYDMLHNLADKGWVERLDPPETPGGSQSYKITDQGELAFAKWLAKYSGRPRPYRETFYLKLALAGLQNAQQLLKIIDSEKQACIDQLEAYATENKCLPAEASEWETLAREMIDEDVTARLHGRLEWLDKVRMCVEHRLAERPQDTSSTKVRFQSEHRDAATG